MNILCLALFQVGHVRCGGVRGHVQQRHLVDHVERVGIVVPRRRLTRAQDIRPKGRRHIGEAARWLHYQRHDR